MRNGARMAALATRIETQAGRPLARGRSSRSPGARETSLSRLLMLYIRPACSSCFSQEPFWASGTCWRSAATAPRIRSLADGSGPWPRPDFRLDRHVHLRVRLLFHSQVSPHESIRAMGGMGVLGAVDLGVALRWLANVYQWQWRIVLPVSAALEIVAFSIFLSRFPVIAPGLR